MIHRQKNIYIYKYLFWAKYPPFYAPDQEKKNLKFFYAPYGLKEYRCKVSTIYLYYYKSYYKLQETSEVLCNFYFTSSSGEPEGFLFSWLDSSRGVNITLTACAEPFARLIGALLSRLWSTGLVEWRDGTISPVSFLKKINIYIFSLLIY